MGGSANETSAKRGAFGQVKTAPFALGHADQPRRNGYTGRNPTSGSPISAHYRAFSAAMQLGRQAILG
jgi:hypothetical protein